MFSDPMRWWTPGRTPWLGCCEQWLRQWRLEYPCLFITDPISCAHASSRGAGSSTLHCLRCLHAGFRSGCANSYPVALSVLHMAFICFFILQILNMVWNPWEHNTMPLAPRYASSKSKDNWFYSRNTIVTPGKLSSMGYFHLTAVYSSVF